MSYGFARVLSACDVGGQVVCLDRNANRYFALGPSASNTVIALSRGLDATDQTAVCRLIARGILSENGAPVKMFDWPPPLASPLEGDQQTREQAADVAKVIKALLKVRWRQRSVAFDQTLSLMEIERARYGASLHSGCDDATEVLNLAQRFAAARRWVPGKPDCLTDSLALIDFLGRAGRDARLVFGVNLTPWAAHCWIQLDEWVLNDSVHRVTALSPILAI